MLLDLPSRQEIQDLQATLNAVLACVKTPAAPAADDMLSVEQVADYTGFHRRTVEKWATEGRFNEAGKQVYLRAYEFTGRLRFKRSDVDAFGLGTGVLTPSLLAGERPTPVKKTKKPVDSQQALKVA